MRLSRETRRSGGEASGVGVTLLPVGMLVAFAVPFQVAAQGLSSR